MGDGGSAPVKCEGYNGTQAGPAIAQESCAAQLREACRPDSAFQTGAVMYGFKDLGNRGPHTVPVPDFGQDLANFLLARGDYAWVSRHRPMTCLSCCD